jgi:hypothetical protein
MTQHIAATHIFSWGNKQKPPSKLTDSQRPAHDRILLFADPSPLVLYLLFHWIAAA